MSKTPDIALIPSGFKQSPPTLYTIIPNDGSQDFQLQRASNATRVRKDGLIEEVGSNFPRLNWLNNNCPSVLIEAERVNRLRQSEDFSSSVYANVNLTVTTNQTVAPNGEKTADKLTRTSTSANYIQNVATKSSATQIDVNISVFVKQGEGDYFAMRLQGQYPNRGEVIYRFSDNTLTLSVNGNDFTAVRGEVDDYGDGWKRLSATFNTDANSTASALFSPRESNGTIDQNDSSTDAFHYVWGCQIEEGIAATSYIPTTTSIVTRNTDNFDCTTTYTLGDDFTLYFDFDAYSYDTSFRSAFLIRNSSFAEYFDIISYQSGGQYYFRARITVGGSVVYLIDFGETFLPFYQKNKIAIRFTNGQYYELYVNGVSVKTGNTGGIVDISKGINLVNDFGNHALRPSVELYDFRIYNQVLTTTEALNLTI